MDVMKLMEIRTTAARSLTVAARNSFGHASIGGASIGSPTPPAQTTVFRAATVRERAAAAITAFTVAILLASTLHAQDRSWGRSMTITRGGIVATSQTLASQAGAQILARGGSAVDAAIASNAVLGLTEPLMTGIGGDLFVIYWDAKTGKLTGLNSSGSAPMALTPEFLAKQGVDRMPGNGIHSVTVPGAVRGWWAMHQKFGKLPWKDLFGTAIAYAENGFPVYEGMVEIWSGQVNGLKSNPESTKVFLPGGNAPTVGQVFKNPELGKAYRLIAEKGPDAYYKGEIAQAIVKTS